MIDAQLAGELILGLLGIGGTIATGLMAILLVNARRRQNESLRLKDLELEKARQARETAEAENAKTKAEAAQIIAEARVKELNAEREKNQAAQNSALQYNWQTMLERAFNRMADSDKQDYDVKTKIAEAISQSTNAIAQSTETSAQLASYIKEGMETLNAGQTALQTDIGRVHVTLLDVEGKVSPLREMSIMLKKLVATANAIADFMQLQGVSPIVPSDLPPDPENGNLPKDIIIP